MGERSLTKVWGWDIETHSPIPPDKKTRAKNLPLDPYEEGALVLTSVLYREGEFVTTYPEFPGESRLGIKETQDVLSDVESTVVGHNILAFDAPWWTVRTGKPVLARIYDTRVLHSLLDPDSPNGLEDLGQLYLNRGKEDEGLDKSKLIEYDPGEVMAYNMSDSHLSLDLFLTIKAVIEERGMWPLAELAMDVGSVLLRQTLRGMWIDEPWIEKQRGSIELRTAQLETELKELTGINPASPKQLAKFLFKDLGAPVLKRSKKTKEPSTDEETIKALRAGVEGKELRQFLTDLLEYRKGSKLWGTYLKPMLHKHRKGDGRIHPTVHLGRENTKKHHKGTVTGRLSMSRPNLQNLPRDPRVRGVLAATPGYRLADADYAQIELRVAAWLSSEQVMIDGFLAGADPHTAALARIRGVSIDEAMRRVYDTGEWSEERSMVKPVNFLILYGGTPYGINRVLAKDYGIYKELWEVQRMHDLWFESAPTLHAWIEETEKRILNEGRLVTPFGRERRLDGGSWDTPKGRRVLRQGVNFIIQSTAADLTLLALTLVDEARDLPPLLTVHDSIIVEYPLDEGHDAVGEQLKTLMGERTIETLIERFPQPEGSPQWESLPLGVDVSTNLSRWGEKND